jgi:PPOX class probable F420-dependent enzyme
MKPEIRALLERPNVVHVATLMPDGAPHSVPVWARVEDRERVAFFTQSSSRKARNLANDPRVAISVTDRDNPYAMGSVRGRVAETLDGDAALEVIDRISHDYTGRPFPMREGIAYLVEVEHEQSMTLPFEDRPPES